MHYHTTTFVDGGLPRRPGVQTHVLRARDYGAGYTLRALIASADQAGDLWLAFTNLPPRNTHHVYAPDSEITVFVRGRDCRYLEYDRERNSLWLA